MSGHQFRRLTGAAIAAAAMAVTACGGEDNTEFIEASNKTTSEISAIGQEIGTAVSGAAEQTDAQLQEEFSTLAGRTGQALKDLQELEGPSDSIDSTIESLSDALTKGETDLESISEAAGSSDADGARTATEALVADSPAISKYNAQLKKQTAELEKEE